MAKTRTRVRTMVGYGCRTGQTYVNVQDLMIFLLEGIENIDNAEVVKDRRHTVEELKKLIER